ncbi:MULTISPECIES: NVEALA domain-containing protein [Bacteroidales]|jgi:hypothetical protein|uniref:NVEALA domain-containing protein n=1 Tax=Bacteroidales TaxID=171549 RepID=UPI0025711C7D|nr:NVEALA domain-containing protein [Bacteroides acidifaciens]
MKKVVFATLVAIAGISGIYAYQTQPNSSDVNMLMLANLEALTSGEDIYMSFCKDMCRDRENEVCSHTTATGVSINCWGMERK